MPRIRMNELKERALSVLGFLGSAIGQGIALGLFLIAGSLGLGLFHENVQPKHPLTNAKDDRLFKKAPSASRFAFQDVLETGPKNPYSGTSTGASRKNAGVKDEIAPSGQPEQPSLMTHAPTRHPLSPDRITKSLAKVLGEGAPVPVQKQLAETLPRSTGSPFAIQVASFSTRSQAQVRASALKKKGYDARVVLGESIGKKQLYRIRLHGFQTVDDAERFRERFESLEGQLAQTIAQ